MNLKGLTPRNLVKRVRLLAVLIVALLVVEVWTDEVFLEMLKGAVGGLLIGASLIIAKRIAQI
jgi:hypothetical protein